MAMLASPDAARKLNEAIELIEAAADAGVAAALERRAVFQCSGVGRPADWGKALDSLQQAAELGSACAARQLILLADDQFEATAPPPSDGGWNLVRTRIPIERRLRAATGTGRLLSANPFIRAIPAMVSAAECRWLIAAYAGRLERATLHNEGIGAGRTNAFVVLGLERSDLVSEMLRARIANEIGAPLPCLEVSQLLRYRVGEQYLTHCDFLDPRREADEIARYGQRAATVLIYLNEDFEGGETSFPQLQIAHRGRTGDALVFGNLNPAGLPDPRTQHAGLPPTFGEKWLFSQWVRDRYPADG